MAHQSLKLLEAKNKQRKMVGHLMRDYLQELSATMPQNTNLLKLKENNFKFPDLDLFFKENTKKVFLLYRQQTLVAVCLLHQNNYIKVDYPVWVISEYYVLPEFRKHGLGVKFVQLLQQEFPKHGWEARVTGEHTAAHTFWSKCLPQVNATRFASHDASKFGFIGSVYTC